MCCSPLPFGQNCYEPLERFIDIMERRQSNGGQQRHYPFRHPKWRYPYLEGPSTRPCTPTRSLLLQTHSHSIQIAALSRTGNERLNFKKQKTILVRETSDKVRAPGLNDFTLFSMTSIRSQNHTGESYFLVKLKTTTMMITTSWLSVIHHLSFLSLQTGGEKTDGNCHHSSISAYWSESEKK